MTISRERVRSPRIWRRSRLPLKRDGSCGRWRMSDLQATTDLASQQSALATALVGNGLTPDGFDGQRLALASKMLLRKRRHSAASSWPALAQCYGGGFEEDFAMYASLNPIPQGASPRDDALGFAKRMADENRLSNAALRLLCIDESRLLVPVRRGRF